MLVFRGVTSPKTNMLNPKIDALGDGNFSGAMRGYAKRSHDKNPALLSIWILIG